MPALHGSVLRVGLSCNRDDEGPRDRRRLLRRRRLHRLPLLRRRLSFRVPQFQYDTPTPQIAKCEMCKDQLAKSEIPACAKVCPTGATLFGSYKALTGEIERRTLDRSMDRLREEMIPKIKQFFRLPHEAPAAAQRAPLTNSTKLSTPVSQGKKVRPKVVVIGVSTGGPTALGAIMPKLPAGFPLPILIVQHMPPLFTRLLAERLNSTCQLPVEEATQDGMVEPGKILIAPGDFHMKLASNQNCVRVSLDQSPRQNSSDTVIADASLRFDSV